jgi:hypothetical protein
MNSGVKVRNGEVLGKPRIVFAIRVSSFSRSANVGELFASLAPIRNLQ